MLVGQTIINFAANVISAAFGLVNVMLYTRLLMPEEYGHYILAFAAAGITTTLTTTWLRLPIMQEQARCDGTDVRGFLASGLVASTILAPTSFVITLCIGLPLAPALASVTLAVAVGLFDTSVELLRARLQAFAIMKAIILRAILVSLLGVTFILLAHSGALLLVATATGYLLACVALFRPAWHGTKLQYDISKLVSLAKSGLPLTLSLTLLSLSSVADRFVIAHLLDTAAAGKFTAGVDLVRQALVIPAVSASAAYVPFAVQIHANQGENAVRDHLEESFEFLFAVVLPACIGFALLSSNIADIIIGTDFRPVAKAVMPIVSIALIFQIMSYQYLHLSFLLSKRNTFYLINTVAALVVNVVVSYFLIQRFGTVGAAWGRLAAEAVGFLSALLLTYRAFPLPFPLARLTRVLVATLVMIAAVRLLQIEFTLPANTGTIVLFATGIGVYAIMSWLLDIARCRHRLSRGLMVMRRAIAS